MKIAIITYNAPHRKTQDLLFRLLANGYKDITLFALPFEQRSFEPLYQHRPQASMNISLDKLCSNLDIDMLDCTTDELEGHFDLCKFDRILIGGCGILPESKHIIINAHPGFLPIVRGLDSFKWAILNGLTVGVTTHFISAEPDKGVLIDRTVIERLPNDTFHSFAYIQYETEVNMLVEAITAKPIGTSLEGDHNYPIYPATKRMGKMDELEMMKKFNR